MSALLSLMPCLHLALNVLYLQFGLISLLRWKQPYIYQMDSRLRSHYDFVWEEVIHIFKNGKPVASRHIIQALQNPRLGILWRQRGHSAANVFRSTCYKKITHGNLAETLWWLHWNCTISMQSPCSLRTDLSRSVPFTRVSLFFTGIS